ncbi:MAG: GHKL domain-containing protein [Lachnospiraceae bacterium]|nr:GHKL domain-containing protein [Lachnospiraceae bacterium]
MLEGILEILHYGIIMIFGIYLSAAFLGIRLNRKNVWILLGFSAVLGAVNAFFYIQFDVVFTEQIYPLIIHLPLCVFLIIFYKQKIVPTILAVFIAYLCCQLSNWVGILFLYITHLDLVYYYVRIITNVTALILLIYFVAAAITQLLQKPTKDIVIFGLIPFVYYVYDYAVTVYSNLFYSGGEVVTEFLGFMLCIFYVLFLCIYFKQYEEKKEIEQRNKTMELQRIQSEKEVEMMKRSEYAVAILRHDMRHFLTDIAGFIENDEKDRALSYIHEIVNTVDKTATKKYCSNRIINMILASYENTIKENGIDFLYTIQIPEKLAISDSDISSILSNGIENAVHAVSFLDEKSRKIKLDLHMNNDKLLISVKNTYAKEPKIVDGLPQAEENGHGFGTQSIRYVTEKLQGNCQFMVDKEYFILRIVL